jgi:hypothetical protein
MPDTNAIANVIVWVFFAVGVITLAYVIVQYLRTPPRRNQIRASAEGRES